MYKKILLILCLFVLSGCSMYNLNNISPEEAVNIAVNSSTKLYNRNNKGFKYYLPIEFTISSEEEINQVLTSRGVNYYMYVDLISYHYKKDITSTREDDDYKYYTFTSGDKNGYFRVKKDGDYFFIELCYNYAIIEVEVEESEINYALVNGISILSSIKYNDLVISKSIGDNDIETSETKYEIPSPVDKSKQNILEYFDRNESNSN